MRLGYLDGPKIVHKYGLFKNKIFAESMVMDRQKKIKILSKALRSCANSNLTHLPYIVRNIFTEGQFKIADFPYVFNYGLIDGKPKETLMIDLSFQKKLNVEQHSEKKVKGERKKIFIDFLLFNLSCRCNFTKKLIFYTYCQHVNCMCKFSTFFHFK
jgi:hypothetical protein